MPYETRTFNLDQTPVQTAVTQRTDFNDAAANDTQSFEDVADDAATIGTVTHEPARGGNVYTWAITSGDAAGQFAVSNHGVLTTVAEELPLVGPYALVIRYTEGMPLHRFRDVEVEVTVAA